MAAAAAKKKPASAANVRKQSAGPAKSGSVTLNVEVKMGQDYAIANPKLGMFSQEIPKDASSMNTT